ncbi:MAG: Gfo/Idh/MocA family oxidoreductase [archaeon]
MKVGVVGLGYWGPNLVRNFDKISKVAQVIVCDLKQERIDSIKNMFPRVIGTTSFDDLLNDPEVKAIAIATQPLATHYPLAKRALEKGKNVLLEKPMTATSAQAMELIALAKKNNVLLHVDHTFEYSAPVLMVKKLIDSGEVGDIHSINMDRLNLGIFYNDFNVIWDLCPHDFAILSFWLGKTPTTVYASGIGHINPKIEDDAHLILQYGNKTNAHLHVSWLYPEKVRTITVVGSKKMIVYDDNAPVEKIRIYDKGVSVSNVSKIKRRYAASFYEYIYDYKHGDIIIPKIDFIEPLLDECKHFIDCIEKGVHTKTDGESGLRVIRLLEAASKSLKEKREVRFSAVKEKAANTAVESNTK